MAAGLGPQLKRNALGGAVHTLTMEEAKKPPMAGAHGTTTPEQQVRSFIAKFEPAHQRLIRAVRHALRRRFPTAYELAYDNYNFFVLGYGPTARPSDAIISIAAGANGVGLCFIHGARLPDPEGILLGSGKQTRFIRVESTAVLTRPAVRTLVAAAAARAKASFRGTGGVTLIVRSVAAKQRPRRRIRAA